MIASLAAFERAPGSSGARAAADTLARELELRGARASLEHERVHGTYWVPIGISCALAATGATRRRATALTAGAIAATLVIHAHHDAARTGLVFHPGLAKLAARLGGRLIERIGGTPAPMWGAAGPALVVLGAALRRPGFRHLGSALSAGYVAAMWNIAHSPVVPAANDNLSGVALLLTLAESLARRPCRRLRVLLLSTGSEESFLEGMEAFAARHRADLSAAATTFLWVESVGSPELMLLSGEGLLRLHRYPLKPLQSLQSLAAQHGIPLHEPFRYRLATDGQVPLRAGYPIAVISSIDWYKAPSNYHWPSDRPENLCWPTIERAARLASALVEELDGCLSSPAPLPRDDSSRPPDPDRPAP